MHSAGDPGGARAAPAARSTRRIEGQRAGRRVGRIKTEFAVDIGGDPSFDGIRALWTSVRK
jgi:hypothetical protein